MLARRAGDVLAFLLSDSLRNKPANHVRCSLAYQLLRSTRNKHIILARKRSICLKKRRPRSTARAPAAHLSCKQHLHLSSKPLVKLLKP